MKRDGENDENDGAAELAPPSHLCGVGEERAPDFGASAGEIPRGR